MNKTIMTPEQFKAIQLGWIAALSQVELCDLMKDLAKPENASMRARTDLSPLATKNGLKLPNNIKLSSDLGPAGEPMASLCWASDPVKGPFHCLTLRNPFETTVSS